MNTDLFKGYEDKEEEYLNWYFNEAMNYSGGGYTQAIRVRSLDESTYLVESLGILMRFRYIT